LIQAAVVRVSRTFLVTSARVTIGKTPERRSRFVTQTQRFSGTANIGLDTKQKPPNAIPQGKIMRRREFFFAN
jgi:hypothetical protein